jgi:hypothetical protein
MQADYPASFERDTGGTEAEWLRLLPAACQGHPFVVEPGRAHVKIGTGSLQLDWQVLPPRRIALLTMPRMSVRYRFKGLDDEARRQFMCTFDLYMLRRGG